MIKISKELALKLIIEGENKGGGLGKLTLNGIEYPVNLYTRIYDDTTFEIAEIEETDTTPVVFYALQPGDVLEKVNSEWQETFDGLKGALNDIVDILKATKEEGEK